MLSVQVETKDSVEKHMRKIRVSGIRSQIAPEPELTKNPERFGSDLSSKDSDMDLALRFLLFQLI